MTVKKQHMKAHTTMDEATQDAIGRALYEACRMDEYPWDGILCKHIWVERAQAVIDAYERCSTSHSQVLPEDDDTGRDV
jgi:hypothetical protein